MKNKTTDLLEFGEVIMSVFFSMCKYYKFYFDTGKHYHLSTVIEGFDLIIEKTKQFKEMFVEKEHD